MAERSLVIVQRELPIHVYASTGFWIIWTTVAEGRVKAIILLLYLEYRRKVYIQ